MLDEKVKKKIGKLVILGVLIGITFFAYTWLSGETKIVTGELMDIQIFSRHDGNHDTVIIFNVSGENKYVVMNEWKTGQIVELDSHRGEMIRLTYLYREFQDKNILFDYEVI